MTIESVAKLATKNLVVSTNEKYRTITFRRKGFGHIEATLSKDGSTITCRCTPNFKETGLDLEYEFNEKSYLHPVRFKSMAYADFRKLVSFLNTTDIEGKALPKPEPTRVRTPKVEVEEEEEELEGTVAAG